MAAPPRDKAAEAFWTIGELSREIGVPQHVLRYWEVRFPQLRPVQRAGGRRHYRPEDVALVRRIHALLERDGFTMRGAQQLLADERPAPAADAPAPAAPAAPDLAVLAALRARLAAALDGDG